MEGDSFVGRVLNETYRIERRLGSGGVGAVYAATHLRTGRPYAVKVLLPETAGRPNAYERFQREAQAVSALGHAGIVAVHDFHRTEDGTPYLVMDLLEGEDLSDRLSREGALSWEDARRIVLEVASALAAAHSLGILHRDLKPANIFIARPRGAPERAMLLDFGLAKAVQGEDTKLTADGTVLGTPSYMSPEQARGQPLDVRSDVYSLATVLYELVCGRAPFEGPHATAVLAAVLTQAPVPTSSWARVPIPAGLDALMSRALDKRPEVRFGDVESFARAIEELGAATVEPMGSGPTLARDSALTPGNTPQTRERPLSPAAGAPQPGWQTPLSPAEALPVAAPPSGSHRTPLLVGIGVASISLVAVAGAAIWLAGTSWSDVQAAQPPAPPVDPAPTTPLPAESRPAPEPVPPEELAGQGPAEDTAPSEEPPAEDQTPAPERPSPPGQRHAERPVRVQPPAEEPPAEQGREGADTSPGGGGVSPGAPGTPPAVMPTPPAGVTEAVAAMQQSDWAGCLRIARAAPVSPQTLQIQVSCGLRIPDRTAVRRACDEHRRRYPRHPFSASCSQIADTM